MSESAARSLRDRLTTPSARMREPGPSLALLDRAERILRIAVDLFDVQAAALVLGEGIDIRVSRVWARGAWRQDDALDAARNLFDALTIAEALPFPAVLEDIAPDRGFRAAAPVLASDGRRVGAICLVDPERRTLLSGLQRRLLAEFGSLVRQERPAFAAAAADAASAAASR